MVGKTALPGRKSNEHAHDKQETAEGKEPQREEQRVKSSGGGGSPATQTNRSDKLEADEEESAQAQLIRSQTKYFRRKRHTLGCALGKRHFRVFLSRS